jgi:hypothetical protein
VLNTDPNTMLWLKLLRGPLLMAPLCAVCARVRPGTAIYRIAGKDFTTLADIEG